MNVSPLVSIIIPIYNVELSIERCARSLFEQTFGELEYIFVNDCTPDNSIILLKKVIDEYPERRDQVVICHHELNTGVAAARNSGLAKARGEYILYVDSDDWAEKLMVEELYRKATENNSDIAWCDFIVEFQGESDNTVYRQQNLPGNASLCIKELLSGLLHGSLWNKLIKRSICNANNIWFPEGINMCEDLVFIILCLRHTERITYLHKAFYHYVQNPVSITINRTRHSFESEFRAVKILEESLPAEIYSKYLLLYKARIKRNVFLSGLFSNDEYLNCFPEATKFVYTGLNRIDKFGIWLSLMRNFSFARIVLFFGRIYSKIKLSLR